MPAKRDTGGHILTEWPFCYVKSAIEHKRRYAHRKFGLSCKILGLGERNLTQEFLCKKHYNPNTIIMLKRG
jgi:hypothetical protein